MEVEEVVEIGVNQHGEEGEKEGDVKVKARKVGKRFEKGGKVVKHHLLPFGGGASLVSHKYHYQNCLWC